MLNNRDKKNSLFLLWVLNIGVSLGLGAGLEVWVGGGIIFRLITLFLGIGVSLWGTRNIVIASNTPQEKSLELIKPFRRYGVVQCMYSCIGFYMIAYENYFTGAKDKASFITFFVVTQVISWLIGILAVIGTKTVKAKRDKIEEAPFPQVYYIKIILWILGVSAGYIVLMMVLGLTLFKGVHNYAISMMAILVGIITAYGLFALIKKR